MNKQPLFMRRLDWLRVFLLGLSLCVSLVPAPAAHSDATRSTVHALSDRARTAQQWLQQLDALPGAWQAIQTLTWFAYPMWIRSFATTQTLSDTAAHITRIAPNLQRAVSSTDMLLLSGLDGVQHFVVQLHANASGTQGFASVLDLSAPLLHGKHAPFDPVFSGLAHSVLVHDTQALMPEGVYMRQTLHAVAHTPKHVQTQLRTILAQQGWREIPAMTTGAYDAQWQHRADHLHLISDRQSKHSLIYQTWTQ